MMNNQFLLCYIGFMLEFIPDLIKLIDRVASTYVFNVIPAPNISIKSRVNWAGIQ